MGKIDRQQLPNPHEEPRHHIAPVNALEALLVELWKELLDVEQVSTDANFLSLGGNSIIATKMVVRLRDTHHYSASIKAVLKHGTIQSLARYLSQL